MDRYDFSLIVPCYNEENVLNGSIDAIQNVFSRSNLTYEVIFVDDKSTDNTVDIIKKIMQKHPQYRFIAHVENMGRCVAVTDGIRASHAPIVGFIDIDLSTSPWYLLRLIEEVRAGADIATAMRVYKLKPQTLFRWVLSKGYNIIMRLFLGCSLEDTETGYKVFNRARITPILDQIKSNHWFWDTEVMVRSSIAGYSIREIPSVFIRNGFSTTVHIAKDTVDYLVNLVNFRKELRKARNGS